MRLPYRDADRSFKSEVRLRLNLWNQGDAVLMLFKHTLACKD